MTYSGRVSSKAIPLALLADAVRLRIVQALDGGEALGVEALAADAEVHVNTVRAHLTRLEEHGVVAREHAATGARGRPAVRYRLADGWHLSAGDLTGLAELLATGLAAMDPSPKQLQTLGHDWGGWLAGRPGARDVGEVVPEGLSRLGFRAEVKGDAVCLEGCPCRAVLPARPELVCRLAAAVVDGMASASNDRLAVGSSVHDPVARRCELRLVERNPGRHRPFPLRLRRG